MVSVFLLAVLSICMVLGCEDRIVSFPDNGDAYRCESENGYTKYYVNDGLIAKIPQVYDDTSILYFDVHKMCTKNPSPHYVVLMKENLVNMSIMKNPYIKSRSRSYLSADMFSYAKKHGLLPPPMPNGHQRTDFEITVKELKTDFWKFLRDELACRPRPFVLTSAPGQDSNSSCVIA